MKSKLSNIFIGCCVIAILFTVSACSESLDIQQVYPFSVETMPVPKKLKVGESAEIRCTLKREGWFEDARYTIRFFQTDGTGILKMDSTIFLPNDRYLLTKEAFRLYYTSLSSEPSVLDVYVEDDAGQMAKLSLNFGNDNTEEKEIWK